MVYIPVIISLTTISSRITTIFSVVSSLLNQTVQADRIVINISSDPYMLDTGIKIQEFPASVRALIVNRKIHVFRVPNTGSYRKLLPTLRRYTGIKCLIATADDDVVYPPYWLNDLLNTYAKHKCIVAYRCRSMLRGLSGLLPYHLWPMIGPEHNEEAILFALPTGRGGILYNSEFFSDLGLLERLWNVAPGQDDLALRVATLISRIPIAVPVRRQELLQSPEFEGFHNPENLFYINREVINGLTENDRAWNRIIASCRINKIKCELLSDLDIVSRIP